MKVQVITTDREYKKKVRTFIDDPNGPPENALRKATKYVGKLNRQDEKSQYGLYRSISISI